MAAIVLFGVLFGSGLVGMPERGAADPAPPQTGEWKSLGDPFDGYDPYVPSIVFDDAGTPYVGFLNPEEEVKKYDGSKWVTVGAANFTGASVSVIKLAIGTDHTLYALVGDSASVNKLTLWKNAGNGWSVLGTANFTPSIQNSNSFGYLQDHVALALASDNTPYVAFPNSTQGYKLTVMRYNPNQDWETVGGAAIVDNSKSTVTNTSMAIDAQDNVFVTVKYANDVSRTRSVYRYDGQSWSNLGDAVINGMEFNTRSAAPIAISPIGQAPYVFATPNVSENPLYLYASKLFAYRDSAWEQVGSTIDNAAPYQINLAIAPDDTIYTTFMNDSTGSTSVLKMAKTAGSDWETILLETEPDLRIVALAVSTTGKPYIVVTDQSGAAVKYYSTVDSAPTAGNVDIAGKFYAGQTLSGTYTYADAEGAAQGASLFKWEVADNANGTNATAIAGATSDSYVLEAAQKGKYIRFEVTPVAATGTTTGVPAASEWKAVSNLSRGDATGDGLITPADALLITKYVQSKIQLTADQLFALDMDNSGTVDAQDAQMILSLYVGNAG